MCHLKHSFKKSSSKELNCKFPKLINGSNLDKKPKMYSCKICEEIVANVESLRNHMRQHVHCSNKAEEETASEHKGKSWRVHECDSCKEKFASPEDFVFHIENSHKEANVMFLG